MATVTGITGARADDILGQSVVSGFVNGAGRLILVRSNGQNVDGGSFIDNVLPAMEAQVAQETTDKVNAAVPPAVSDAVNNAVAGNVFAKGNISGALSFVGLTNVTLVNALIKGTLVGNLTVNAGDFPAVPRAGTQFALILTQDNVGGRTLTLTGIKRSMGVLSLTAAANAIDIISFMYDGTNWYAGAMGLNFT